MADEALDHATRSGKYGRECLELYVLNYTELGLDELSPTISLRESEALDVALRTKINQRRL